MKSCPAQKAANTATDVQSVDHERQQRITASRTVCCVQLVTHKALPLFVPGFCGTRPPADANCSPSTHTTLTLSAGFISGFNQRFTTRGSAGEPVDDLVIDDESIVGQAAAVKKQGGVARTESRADR